MYLYRDPLAAFEFCFELLLQRRQQGIQGF